MSTSADAGDRAPVVEVVVDHEGASGNGHVWGRRDALNNVGRIARVRQAFSSHQSAVAAPKVSSGESGSQSKACWLKPPDGKHPRVVGCWC